jgi:hypothetical protein
MHGPINVKSPNNTSKWQMVFNSAFKGLIKNIFHGLFSFYITKNLQKQALRFSVAVNKDQ